MDLATGIRASIFFCLAIAASGCHEMNSQSMELLSKAVVANDADEKPAYIGDIFSEVQKALAALPRSEPEAIPLGD